MRLIDKPSASALLIHISLHITCTTILVSRSFMSCVLSWKPAASLLVPGVSSSAARVLEVSAAESLSAKHEQEYL